MTSVISPNISAKFRLFFRSVWFFPTIVTFILIALTSLGVHGSSIGIYHGIFYGQSQKDSDLLFNQPESIRSDEWIVVSQKSLAQEHNNFAPINKNLGNGEDQTLLADIPSTDWTTFFKPHNIGFLLLPFENAFSLRWWLFPYLLVLGCYFLTLLLLPGRKKIAASVSLAVVFSPFFHWWYIYGTFASVYYCLFAIISFIKLVRSESLRTSVVYSAILAYLGVAFALILYPPFQIPCLMASIAFCAGYLFENRRNMHMTGRRIQLLALSLLSIVLVIASILAIIIYQKRDIISTITNTAYPGQRVVASGGYDVLHLATSSTAAILQSSSRAPHYQIPGSGAVNQSESSNFILIAPWLLIPSVYLIVRRKQPINYILLSTCVCAALFVAWMTIPNLDLIGKFTLLDKVPHQRLVIGLGLLNFFALISFIAMYIKTGIRISIDKSIIYSLFVFIALLMIHFFLMTKLPGFISYKLAIAFALPIPVITYLILRKNTLAACSLLVLFSLASVYAINPLYRGVSVLTHTPLSEAIREIGKDTNKRWVSESIYLENFATLNGEPSLTGTYLYPQLKIWDDLNQNDQRSLYNRYAHINVIFDRDPDRFNEPVLRQPSMDQFTIDIEPCDPFLRKYNVGYLLTASKLESEAVECTTLIKEVLYPQAIYYIYYLHK